MWMLQVHLLQVEISLDLLSFCGCSKRNRNKWWTLKFLMITFLRSVRYLPIFYPNQTKHLRSALPCTFTIIYFLFSFDACLCSFSLLLFLLLTISASQNKSALFFVLVARGRIINLFNEIKIRQKMGYKDKLCCRCSRLQMKTKILGKHVKMPLSPTHRLAWLHTWCLLHE